MSNKLLPLKSERYTVQFVIALIKSQLCIFKWNDNKSFIFYPFFKIIYPVPAEFDLKKTDA